MTAYQHPTARWLYLFFRNSARLDGYLPKTTSTYLLNGARQDP